MIDESDLTKSPDLAKVLDLFNSQTGTVNTLWNIFIAVNLAITGFLYKDTNLGGYNDPNWKEHFKIKIAFTLGFLIFAYANRMAILRSQRVIFAISEFLRNLELDASSKLRPILLAHDAVSPNRMKHGHWVFTAMIALIIWSAEIQRILQR
jgi:hypothetical protein